MDSDSDQCDNCGMAKDGNCCKDESQFIKNSLDQQNVESYVQGPEFNGLVTPADLITVSEYYYFSLIGKYPISHTPPVETGTDIFIRNCVFRI